MLTPALLPRRQCHAPGAVYLNVNANTGAGCSDTLTLLDAGNGATPCADWRSLQRVHTTIGGAGIREYYLNARCVPLEPALWPVCCAPGLMAPAGCPWPPLVIDLPQLLCPAPT